MKKQQRITPQKPRENKHPEQHNILDEIKKRQVEQETETVQRAAEQTKREHAQAETINETEVLNARIEAMLSRNPDEFVIRFLQTEGQ